MDPLDELFSKDGWIITTNIDGKTKIASGDQDETHTFDKTRNNWITLNETNHLSEDQKSSKIDSKQAYKLPFQTIATKNKEHRVGFYLLRDLLTLKKPNGLTKAFLIDNIPLIKVTVSARLTSFERTNNYYRLILDDNTSSILCMIKIDEDNVQEEERNYEREIETSFNRTEEINKNDSLSWALKKLESQNQKLIVNTTKNFDQTSLGRHVRIVGRLCEFCGKNFIQAYHFRWISEESFVNFFSYIVESYEYKKNYMFEQET